MNLYTEKVAIVSVDVSSTEMPVRTWRVRIMPKKNGMMAMKKMKILLSDWPSAKNIQSMYLNTRNDWTSFIDRNWMQSPSIYVMRIYRLAIPW